MAATPRDESGWTIETYSAYNEGLREAEEKFQAERDRRYAEVEQERARALAIKEKADERALNLQAETQAYKDEKANELREQINSERGTYLSRDEYLIQHQALEDKLDTALKPLTSFVTTQQGRAMGVSSTQAFLFAVVTLVIALVTVYALFHTHTVSPTSTVTVTVPSK